MFCFAGAGSGEVMVGERKVVGISQRRTRDAARFQCACVLHWNAEPAFAVLPGLDAHRARVEGAGMGVGEGQPGRRVAPRWPTGSSRHWRSASPGTVAARFLGLRPSEVL